VAPERRAIVILRVVGERFVVALERLMGLVLVALSIEMMLRGLRTFVKQLMGA
jgi:small neutral amino acid transporter SnatA (MarC family)